MKEIPSHLNFVTQTKIFNQTNVPKALLKQHYTPKGRWGKIKIFDGCLKYVILPSKEEQILTPDFPGVIEPETPHFIELKEPVQFQLEFYE